MPIYNPELMRLALWRLQGSDKDAAEKLSFVPSPGAAGGDPSGGMPGGDPAAGGAGMPPGMDPAAMAGGPPPMAGGDPAAGGGGAPPGGGGLGAGLDLPTMIQQAVQQAVQQAMGGMGGAGAAGAGGMGKPMKADINTVAMDIFQVKKLLTNIYQINNWPLPTDIIDGPNRDPASGAAMPPGAPGSTSDPNAPSQAAPPGGAGAAAGGDQSAIQPISPMQGAFPGAGGGAEKGASTLRVGYEHEVTANLVTKAAALSTLMKKLKNRRELALT